MVLLLLAGVTITMSMAITMTMAAIAGIDDSEAAPEAIDPHLAAVRPSEKIVLLLASSI